MLRPSTERPITTRSEAAAARFFFFFFPRLPHRFFFFFAFLLPFLAGGHLRQPLRALVALLHTGGGSPVVGGSMTGGGTVPSKAPRSQPGEAPGLGTPRWSTASPQPAAASSAGLPG